MNKSWQNLILILAVSSLSSGLTYVSSARWAEPRYAAPTGSSIRWITLHDLERSLPPTPVDVVFDIDDTALFSSPGFQWGTRTYGKNIVTAGSPIREEDLPNQDDRRKYREFWVKMNNELDQYSIRKWIASELVGLHKRRGDRIHFVSKRIKTDTEHLTERLRETFELPDLPPVIFTNRSPKTAAFRSVHAQISYGDSDTDIRDSVEAGARPIRVLRSPASVNLDPVHNGGFGEEVLVNSES